MELSHQLESCRGAGTARTGAKRLHAIMKNVKIMAKNQLFADDQAQCVFAEDSLRLHLLADACLQKTSCVVEKS